MKKYVSFPSSSNPMNFAAIFVSLCALAVSIYQSYIFRNQQYAIVWPYIEPRVEYTNQSFAFFIQNKGTGPAIIKNISLELDGKLETSYSQFIQDLLKSSNFTSMSISDPANSVLSAGEKVEFMSAHVSDTLQTDFPARTTVRICYCSIFGDCWQYTDGEVEKVNSCK
jgi:hypothetical protein